MNPGAVETSKFLSLVLRHRPGRIGLVLDANGWAEVSQLIEGAAEIGVQLSEVSIREVVEQNDKQRFALSPDGKRIRANQGHSISVDLSLDPVEPPDYLYHGTATHRLKSIRNEGLTPGRRKHVHLSPDRETATRVGSRHGTPVVLRIETLRMHRGGLEFYLSKNGVWLTHKVPVEYIEFPDELPRGASQQKPARRMPLIEFQTVQIKALLREDGAYDPFGDNDRAPRMGDRGTVVEVRGKPSGQYEYTVECGRPDGTCVWIADFVAEELEAIDEEEREAIETDAWRTERETTPESLSTGAVSPQYDGADAKERIGSQWRLYAGAVVPVLLSLALVLAVLSWLFFVWPPVSAAAAGLRAAMGGVALATVGALWSGEKIVEWMITSTVVGAMFFVLGAAGWHVWMAG